MIIKVDLNKVVMLLSIIIMNEPPIFYNYNKVDIVYKLLQVVLMMYAVSLMILNGLNKSISAVFVYCIIRSVTTFIFNPSDSVVVLYRMCFLLSFIYLFFWFCSRFFWDYLNILCNTLIFYTILNFLLYLKYPHGIIQLISDNSWENIYFLGLDNQFARIIIPAIGLLCFLPNRWNGLLNTTLSILIILINGYVIFACKSATLIISYIVLILGFIFSRYWKIIFLKRILLIAYVIIFFIFVIFNQLGINFIADFVNNFLQKDITFSGRTLIWMNSINIFLSSPIWGHGATASGNIVGNLSAHNILLQILVENGLIGLISFLYIFFVTLRGRSNSDRRINTVSYVVIFSIMVSMLGEVYSLEYLFTFLIIIYIYGSLLDKKERVQAE